MNLKFVNLLYNTHTLQEKKTKTISLLTDKGNFLCVMSHTKKYLSRDLEIYKHNHNEGLGHNHSVSNFRHFVKDILCHMYTVQKHFASGGHYKRIIKKIIKKK